MNDFIFSCQIASRCVKTQPALIANKKPAGGGFEILMVAGAGFEPTTFGL